ncbi:MULTISPECIES: FomB family phosphonate monophosphate kinase [Kitasatospora]|uniref:FomB family phosphonate monophosphate kinase n=1 Tax=Kitasatospora TaxID=2063 RepID=UPI00030C8526|nr:FomB family phosphonate monophosphate kinase [Kitasatospora setae]
MSRPTPLDLSALPVRSTRTADLGLLTLQVTSNLEHFDGHAYFARDAAEGTRPDYRVDCLDLDRDAFDPAEVAALADDSLRARRFRGGYYLSHIHGEPAYLRTDGSRAYVFGRRLERTVWPYFVKRVLTDFAADRGYLHLKAAGFALGGGRATLLVGPNGGGKTVFLSQACLAGARFLTNTHVLVREGVAHGVPTSVRIRRDDRFGPLIDRHGLTPHLESGDYLAPAELVFGGRPVDRAVVRNVVVVDYNPRGRVGVEEIDPATAETFLSQYAHAVTTYGLKDDVLAHQGRDVAAFSRVLGRMNRQLAGLVCSARCFRVNADLRDPAVRDAVLERLAG